MFNEIFKKLREEKNITQKELATYLNVTDRLIRYYETGHRMPPADILGKIADYFNVSVDYLLGRTDIKKPIQNIVKENLPKYSSHKQSIDIENLSSESQEDLKRYIELLKIKDMQKRNSETSGELTNLD